VFSMKHPWFRFFGYYLIFEIIFIGLDWIYSGFTMLRMNVGATVYAGILASVMISIDVYRTCGRGILHLNERLEKLEQKEKKVEHVS
jgi:hypothetical protein